MVETIHNHQPEMDSSIAEQEHLPERDAAAAASEAREQWLDRSMALAFIH